MPDLQTSKEQHQADPVAVVAKMIGKTSATASNPSTATEILMLSELQMQQECHRVQMYTGTSPLAGLAPAAISLRVLTAGI